MWFLDVEAAGRADATAGRALSTQPQSATVTAIQGMGRLPGIR